MLYITGKNERLETLATQEEFSQFLKDEKSFNQLNPHLMGFRKESYLPPHTPILFSTESAELKEFVNTLYLSSYEEKERLWLIQESQLDIPTMLATEDLMSEAQKYVQQFRKSFDNPLISTPWGTSDPALTNSSVLDILSGVSGAAAGAIHRARHISLLDPLYEAICKRSALDEEIARLSIQKGKFYLRIAHLEKEARVQTGIIKSLIPKKVDDTLVKFLNQLGLDYHRLRGNSASKKIARKGKSSLGLEFLNKSGLENAKKMINRFVKLGNYAEKGSFALGLGLVAYDTVQAYRNKKDFTRTLLTGSSAFGASLYLGSLASSSAWGACVIGTLTGDAAIGGLVLASCPFIGTVVLVVVGAAAVGYASYKIGEWVGEAYDSDMGQKLREHIHKSALDLYYRLESAWKSSERWIIDFYGADIHAR